MYKLRPKDERGKTINNWLNSSHTFSFADYFDPAHMGFSDLRVINDDFVDPETGFGAHRHDNMEIISIVLSGALEHKDSTGTGSIIQPGEIQKMSAGTGIVHSEFNPSLKEPVHFLQIWILPDKKGLTPSYEQKAFSRDKMLNKLCLIVSPEGKDESFKINQDAKMYQTIIETDKTVTFDLPEKRKIWIQVALGAIEVNKEIMEAGDGLAIVGEKGKIELKGVDEESNVIIFDLKE